MIYFGLTPAKCHYYLDKYKGVAFCHNLNETELKLCHFVTVLKLIYHYTPKHWLAQKLKTTWKMVLSLQFIKNNT